MTYFFVMRFLTQFLVICALITAGISPACAFVGGTMEMMEICASDGSVKTIPVPEGYESPIEDQDSEPDDSANLDDLELCSFCLFQSGGKSLAFLQDISSQYDFIFSPLGIAEQNLLIGNTYNYAHARAPPDIS